MKFRPDLFSSFVIEQWALNSETHYLAKYAEHLKIKYVNNEKSFIKILLQSLFGFQNVYAFQKAVENLNIQNAVIYSDSVRTILAHSDNKLENDYGSWINSNTTNQQVLVYLSNNQYEVVDVERLFTSSYTTIEKVFSIINNKISRPFYDPASLQGMSIRHENRKEKSFLLKRLDKTSNPNTKYAGSKPVSRLHENMIFHMWKVLGRLGFIDIKCGYQRVNIPGGTWRVPDTEAIFNGQKFYLEVQVSDIDSVRVSSKNYDYRILGCVSIWVISIKFANQILSGNPLASASYIFQYNRYNVFCMNKEMDELYVIYQVPYVYDDVIRNRIKKEPITNWNEQISIIDNIPCFFDYYSELEKCQKTINKNKIIRLHANKRLEIIDIRKKNNFCSFVKRKELFTTNFLFRLRELYQYYMVNNKFKYAKNIADAMNYFETKDRRFYLGSLLLWLRDFREKLSIDDVSCGGVIFDLRDYDYASFFEKFNKVLKFNPELRNELIESIYPRINVVFYKDRAKV